MSGVILRVDTCVISESVCTRTDAEHLAVCHTRAAAKARGAMSRQSPIPDPKASGGMIYEMGVGAFIEGVGREVTLADFLLARIAEDEGVASHGDGGLMDHEDGARFDRRRVLAECEAKRRIVAELDRASADYDYGSGAAYAERLVLPLMAAVYADHPDYRDEWRP